MGFIFIAFSNYVGGLFTAIPIIIFVLFIGIFLAIVLGGVGIDVKDYWWMGLLVVLTAGWIAASAFGLFDSSYWQFISAFIPWDFVIGVVVFILVMWLLLREKKEEVPVKPPAEQQPVRPPARETPPQQQEITPEMRREAAHRQVLEQYRQLSPEQREQEAQHYRQLSPQQREQAAQDLPPEIREQFERQLRGEE